MRLSNHRARFTVVGALVSAIVIGCGGPAATSPPPSARATPVVTPDPHLTEPATADELFGAIRLGDLPLSVNNATAGLAGDPLVKRINADIGNWPLVISEFRSAAALRQATGWDASEPPAQGDPPYAFVGLNLLVEFGPITGPLANPDDNREAQAEQLVALIDPLLWPLEQRSVDPIETRTDGEATASPAATTSASAAASPQPSPAP
jgi:hypothetical protein